MCRCAVTLMVLLMAWLLSGLGCSSPAASAQGGSYTTVRADPARDTAAARTLNQRGLEQLEAGHLSQAESLFKQALTADVEFGPAHSNLGKVYFRQSDWYKAAWEFEYAAKLMPKRAEPRNNLGLVLERVGEMERAIEQYRHAMALDPESPEYRGNLVRALVRHGDRSDEVRQLLQQVVEKDPRRDWQTWARQQQIRMESSTPP